ncbi:hypothetical protein AB0912_33865 [Streptomyces sp. NPDC007084]|uniref:hypothetical protein n=1 Tax=Streptomyces sp. NPDC007084 TaxID=3154313 RepID=UPI0034565D2F
MSTPLSSPASDRSGISLDAHDTPPEPRHPDPFEGLVHAAVADRPLEEVIQLITLLEQSPDHARAAVDALRAVGVDRPVDDVGRLVAELASPPRNPDSADEVIRSAAESRPVEDVSRLMALLHRPSVESHCAEEAVRAVAARRPVEELVELIGRLSDERARRDASAATDPGHDHPAAAATSAAPGPSSPSAFAPSASVPARENAGPPSRPASGEDDAVFRERAGRAPRTRGGRDPVRTAAPPDWLRRLVAVAVVVCGAMYLPLRHDGATPPVQAFGLAVFGLCLLLAAALLLRGAVPLLVAAVLLPSALAALGLLEGRLHSTSLSQASHIAVAPPWAAGVASAGTALAALVALLVTLTADRTARRLAPPAAAKVSTDRAAR